MTMKDDIKALLAEFSQAFEQKLNNTKAEVLELHSKTTTSLAQKLKDAKTTKWRREGNQRQFEFNLQVTAKFFTKLPNLCYYFFVLNNNCLIIRSTGKITPASLTFRGRLVLDRQPQCHNKPTQTQVWCICMLLMVS